MTSLKTMSFNIRLGLLWDGRNRWYKRRELVFDVMRQSGSQLFGLQEVFPFQLSEILRAFPALGAIADKRYGGRWTGTYAPILFDARRFEAAQSGDFWLAADPYGRRARGWDAAVPRICTWVVLKDRENQGRRFAVFNSHFDQAGVEARAASARLVGSRLEAFVSMPRLITVDLNAGESSEPARILAAAGYRDTFRELHPTEEANSYHGFRGKGARSLGKIDYVLCDEKWDVCAASIVRDGRDGRFPSDHFPMTAEVALKPQRRR